MIREIINKYKFMKSPIDYSRKKGVSIGSDCQILGSVFPFGSEPYLISIGNHVRINCGCQFVTHDGSVWCLRDIEKYNPEFCGQHINFDELNDIDLFGSITVGNNVQIGERVIVLPDVHIGNNVIIGACSVVTKDIPDNSVAVGVPARVIESIDDYYLKNYQKFVHTKTLSPSEKKDYLLNMFGGKSNVK